MDSCLLQEIQKGKKLRSTKTIDKSGPYIPKNEFNTNETTTDVQSIGENNNSFDGQNRVKVSLNVDLPFSTKSNNKNAVENKIATAKKDPSEYFQAPVLQQQVTQNSNVQERNEGARSLPPPPPPPQALQFILPGEKTTISRGTPAPQLPQAAQEVPPQSSQPSASQTFHPAAKTLSAAENVVTTPQLQHAAKDTCKIKPATPAVINVQPTSTNSQKQQGSSINLMCNKQGRLKSYYCSKMFGFVNCCL